MRGLPLWRALGGRDDGPRADLCLAASIPASAAYETVERTRAAGYRAFKVKVGFGEETDLGSLAARRQEPAGPASG